MQEYPSSLSQSEGLDLGDMSTLPESPDVTLDNSHTIKFEDLTASSQTVTQNDVVSLN